MIEFGRKVSTEITVTPEIVTESYRAQITPTWTSVPTMETIIGFGTVTPVIETEQVTDTSTVTLTKRVHGKEETYTTI
jgi:ribosome-binding protein aMBF1 (putative translation factor)